MIINGVTMTMDAYEARQLLQQIQHVRNEHLYEASDISVLMDLQDKLYHALRKG